MTVPYTYNLACLCEWCRAGGQPPYPREQGGSWGHSWCYEQPHIEPVRASEALPTTHPESRRPLVTRT